jgi:putative phosphoribosyl transferase
MSPGATAVSVLPYRDRQEGASHLALHLKRFAGAGTVVFGIPRGGVPIAAEIAEALGAPLDIVVARKLGSPFSPELAIGAVTADGGCFLNYDVLNMLSVSNGFLHAEIDRQLRDAKARDLRFRGRQAPTPVRGRVALVCDDGLATGATMHAAVRALRSRGAARIVVAVPVGSSQACQSLAGEADEVICPEQPEPFGAVGQHYLHFEPVDDDAVARLLQSPEKSR